MSILTDFNFSNFQDVLETQRAFIDEKPLGAFASTKDLFRQDFSESNYLFSAFGSNTIQKTETNTTEGATKGTIIKNAEKATANKIKDFSDELKANEAFLENKYQTLSCKKCIFGFAENGEELCCNCLKKQQEQLQQQPAAVPTNQLCCCHCNNLNIQLNDGYCNKCLRSFQNNTTNQHCCKNKQLGDNEHCNICMRNSNNPLCLLGAGAYGIVHKQNGNAIKTVKGNSNDFQHEIKMLSHVQSIVGVVKLFESSTEKKQIVMELCHPLKSYLKKQPSQKICLSFLTKLYNAINELHDMGVVHCDIKLDNTQMSTELNAKIIDFGLAQMKHDGTYQRQGTPLYTKLDFPDAPTFTDYVANDWFGFMRIAFVVLCTLQYGKFEHYIPQSVLDQYKEKYHSYKLPNKLVGVNDNAFFRNWEEVLVKENKEIYFKMKNALATKQNELKKEVCDNAEQDTEIETARSLKCTKLLRTKIEKTLEIEISAINEMTVEIETSTNNF